MGLPSTASAWNGRQPSSSSSCGAARRSPAAPLRARRRAVGARRGARRPAALATPCSCRSAACKQARYTHLRCHAGAARAQRCSARACARLRQTWLLHPCTLRCASSKLTTPQPGSAPPGSTQSRAPARGPGAPRGARALRRAAVLAVAGVRGHARGRRGRARLSTACITYHTRVLVLKLRRSVLSPHRVTYSRAMPPHQAAQSHAERGAQRNTSSPSPKRSCCLQATGVQPGSDSGGTCAQRRRGAHAGGVRRHGAHAARAPATAAGARLARLQRRQHRHMPGRASLRAPHSTVSGPAHEPRWVRRSAPAPLRWYEPGPQRRQPLATSRSTRSARWTCARPRPAETDGGALRARRPAQQRAEPARRAQMSPQQVPTNFAVTLLWPCVRIRRARGTPHTHLRVQPRSLGRVAGGPRRTPPPDDAEDQQRKRRAVLVAGAHAPQALEGGNECEGPAARSHQKGCRARRAANRRRGGSPAPRAALRAPAGGTHRAKAPWGRCAESNSQVSRGPPCAHPRVNIAGMARRRGGAPLAPGAVRSHRGPAPGLG